VGVWHTDSPTISSCRGDDFYVLVYMKGDVVDIAFNASFDVLGAVHVLERVVK